ncbi:MAG: hypothetical protein ABWW69_04825 [Pyrodictiaceae archaeon]
MALRRDQQPILATPCEVAVKKYIPAIRAAIAIVLVKEYGLTAYRAAKLLGVTPAAISNYLLGRRGGKLVNLVLASDELRSHVYRVAEKLLSGLEEKDVIRDLCRACRELRRLVENSEGIECLAFPS